MRARDEDDDEFEPDDCDHMGASIDILTGRLVCDCGFTKWLSSAESKARMEFEQRAQADWDEFCAAQEISAAKEQT